VVSEWVPPDMLSLDEFLPQWLKCP
jgi:hypothetical protein